jgi:type IV pilus assembly protein PilY1
MGRDQNRLFKTSARSRLLLGVVSGLLAFAAGNLQAAPGVISQLPLFLVTPVQPNIFFLLDDSGSMDQEDLLAEGADIYGTSGGHYFNFAASTTSTEYSQIRANLMHCVGFNVLAYDPTKTYTPWAGSDKDGNKLADQSVTSAMVNPFTGSGGGDGCTGSGVYNANGRTCNLKTGFSTGKGAFYYIWYDRDKDGEYDKGECSSDSETNDDYTASDRKYVKDQSAADQVNYANWFSYYRKREYVMKRAVSEVIFESTERVGLATINRNKHVTGTPSGLPSAGLSSDHVGTQVKDLDDLTVPINTTAQQNKKDILNNLLGVNSNSWTPLVAGLDNVGLYFMNKMSGSSLFGYTPINDTDGAYGHSPILSADYGGSCQQNFAIVMSDGYWNNNYLSEIGGVTDLTNTDIDDENSPYDGQSYGDSAKLTLADVAMHYYETDLLPEITEQVTDEEGNTTDVTTNLLADMVAPTDIYVAALDATECADVAAADASKHPNCFDTNPAQHLVTYTVAFGITGNIPLEAADGVECLPPSRAVALTDVEDSQWPSSWSESCTSVLEHGWPTPSANNPTTVDDMRHAAWNGRGLFLSAKNPDELIDSLREAISDIGAKNPVSAAAVAVDSSSIIGGGNVVQGKFDSTYWTGELYSYAVTVTADDGVVVSSTATWAAHEKLKAKGFSTRNAVTHNGTKAIAFAFPSDYTTATAFGNTELSQAQVDDLMTDAPYPGSEDEDEIAENQAYGESLVDYLLGDKSNEGNTTGKFRNRNGYKLGDIVHSAPVYVGDPDPTLYYDTAYQTWATDPTTGAKGRQDMIYVGANDGGLHAFYASGDNAGEEAFVYFPQAVFSTEDRGGLHYLADLGYEHHYYVDGEVTVAEVFADFDGTGEKWSTVLIGTLGGGGRSIFAIDVSDPSEFTTASGVASNILWEYSHNELGFTFSKATVAKMNNGRWAAIFGNGYNQGSAASGEASLFIKYLDSATQATIIKTGVGNNDAKDCLDSGSNCNGLSSPAVVDLGADGIADRAYAGDILGNLWAFDLSSDTATSWNVANTKTPLFTAKDSDNVAQPITTQPAVILHPTVRHDNTSPNTMLYFGTGRYLVESDPLSTAKNTFYGIWDSGSAITASRSDALVEQKITKNTLAGVEVRTMTNNPIDYTADRGWFVDLPDSGERVIANAIVFGEVVVYNTIVPEDNLCSDAGGYSWLMVHDLFDGSEPDYIALDVTGDGSFDENDQLDGTNITGKRSGTLNWQITLTRSGAGAEATAFVPAEDLDTESILGGRSVGSRSSWGRFQMD